MERTTVWIDHETTHIFDYDAEGIHARPQLHNKVEATHSGRTDEHTKLFYHDVATSLMKSDHVLLLGPGQAKEEFRNHCEDHHPLVGKAIFRVESMKDHPSDSEILKMSSKLYKEHFNWTHNEK